MARNKTAAPKTARAPKPNSIQLDLADLVARFDGRLAAWQKPVPFDFDHVAATSICLLLDTPEGTRTDTVVTYSGRLTEKQARHLTMEHERPVADRAKLEAALMRRGYNLATPTAPARKKTRRRKAD